MPTALLLLLAGCFTSHNNAVTSEYARQVSTASVRVSQLEQQLVASQDRIAQLEEVIRLQGQSQAARLENLDEVNDELARLRGAIEVLQFEGGQLKTGVTDQQVAQEQRQLYDEARLRQLEGLLGVKPPPPPAAAGEAPTDGAAAVPAPGAPEEPAPADLPPDAAGRLEVAVGHMEGGRYALARVILQRALDENAGAPEIAEIRYRFAETWLSESNWREALLAFRKVPDNHPDSDWACWAYLRQGEAMEQLQGLPQAQSFYKGAVAGACKNSEAAKLAKKKL